MAHEVRIKEKRAMPVFLKLKTLQQRICQSKLPRVTGLLEVDVVLVPTPRPCHDDDGENDDEEHGHRDDENRAPR